MTEEQLLTFLFALAKVTEPNADYEIKGDQNAESDVQMR